MRILVCGSRGWIDERAMRERMERYERGEETTILHGGAKGADVMAGRVARAMWMSVEVFPADWETYGRAAGFRRNVQMLETKLDLVLAFWDGKSPGTKHTINEALSRKIDVEVIFPREAVEPSRPIVRKKVFVP